MTTAQIAGILGAATKNVIIGKAHKLGLPKRKRGARRRSIADRPHRHQHDPSNQRRFLALKPHGSRYLFGDDHPPIAEGRTLFPTRVFDVGDVPNILISGHNSRKIGKMVMKGRWKGMPIFTLTLEERKTCPRTCSLWRKCYGNNMPFSRRIRHGDAFETALWGAIEALQARFEHGFVLRLHVLGDFYSVPYVELWERALAAFPGLRVFGYTARLVGEPIGAAIFALQAANWDRFAVRFSGAGFSTRCTEVVERPEEATGIICPAQLDPTGNRACATCALCWQSERTITFLEH